MRAFFNWLLTINHSNEDVRRRGRNVVILALGMITLCLLFTLLLLFSATPAWTYAIIAVGALLYTGVLIGTRRGYVTLSAVMFILAITCILFSSIWMSQSLMSTP